MNRRQRRQRLLINWLGLVLLGLAPLVVIWAVWGLSRPTDFAMPVFIAALLSLFVSLPFFQRYKRALIATGEGRDTDVEASLWQALVSRQQQGMFIASLPVWIGALGIFAGLEAVPLILLALGSLTIFWVYKLPKQLD